MDYPHRNQRGSTLHHEEESLLSATVGGESTQHPNPGPAEKMGFTRGQVVQELGWDNDTDDDLRIAIEDALDADMVDGDYGNVVESVLLWWRDEDGDQIFIQGHGSPGVYARAYLEGMPCPTPCCTSWRNLDSWVSVSRPSRKARA